ncbi:MAG: sensor histidine kinase [Caldilineaceae bacterium]|nr:sensor histidine kinase [Caldilineaceae bacterium]
MNIQYNMVLIFFVYGLAFFSMGLAITLEANRGSDTRLRHGLRALAIFGILHGIHEWVDMFELLDMLPGHDMDPSAWHTARIAMLEFSFLFLAAFGATLLPRVKNFRRASILVPMLLATIWGVGIVVLRGFFTIDTGLWDVADVWTRYAVAVPAGLLACIGLIGQWRLFRKAGMERFGRDALLAAIAFALYGLLGQTIVRASPLPPSNVLNQDFFLRTFGFPIQLLRAGAAVVSAWAIIRFLRSFEYETQRKIAMLQEAQLQEAQRREALRGQLLRQVVSAQEAERQRIARELHDATGQSLTAIGLGLRGVTNTLRQDTDKAADNLRQLEGLVARSLDELQRLIADLRPSHLDDLGLPAALRWYAGEVQNRTHLNVAVEINGEPHPIDSLINTALFRVAQEALTNVVKHAGATHVSVRLSYLPSTVMLQVEDNGRGFEVSARAERPAWGLLGMEERASLLEGHVTIRSQPGQGTCVEMTIPYHSNVEVGDGNTTIARG